MKRKFLCAGLTAAMVLSLAACGESAGSDSQAAASGSESQAGAAGATAEFIVGGMGPLTGSAASYGISVRQGI